MFPTLQLVMIFLIIFPVTTKMIYLCFCLLMINWYLRLTSTWNEALNNLLSVIFMCCSEVLVKKKKEYICTSLPNLQLSVFSTCLDAVACGDSRVMYSRHRHGERHYFTSA